jgi:hypothetical protein
MMFKRKIMIKTYGQPAPQEQLMATGESKPIKKLTIN